MTGFNYLSDLTQNELKALLHYEPLTGVFTWKIEISGFVKKGDTAGNVCQEGYVVIGINDKLYRAHRLAWLYVVGRWPDGDIDHKNRKRNENWFDNLRETKNGNQRNAKVKSNNVCGLKGVRKKNNKWESRIKFNGKAIHLGYHDTAEKAHTAYIEAAKFYFGEFAHDGT